MYVRNRFLNEIYGFTHSFHSLIPRPFPAPVFDHLQYAKTEPEGLVNLTM